MKGRMRGRLFKVWSTEHRSAFSGQPANRATNSTRSKDARGIDDFHVEREEIVHPGPGPVPKVSSSAEIRSR